MVNARHRIQHSFDKQTLLALFDARLEEVADGHVVISAPISDAVLQQHGVAHAGLTFAIGDSAAGYAALSLLPEHEVMTAEMKINLLAPGEGAWIKAVGRVIRPGRRLVVVAADVFAVTSEGAETLVAVLQGTMVPLALETTAP